jgi:hypothetical protein
MNHGPLVNQPDAMPTRKWMAMTMAGAASTIVVWGISQLGVVVPPEIQGAIQTLLVGMVGYMVHDRMNA